MTPRPDELATPRYAILDGRFDVLMRVAGAGYGEFWEARLSAVWLL